MRFRSRSRLAPAGPDSLGEHRGLSYALYLPVGDPLGGIVILHGASSCKERHLDFARAARGAGFAAIAYDQRGHGASEGELGDRAIEDLGSVAELLPAGPLVLRGSSMGGYLALVGAEAVGAAAVIAICPASATQLRRGIDDPAISFAVDRPAIERFLDEHPLQAAVATLRVPLLLMHASGDERVPVEQSSALLDAAGSPVKRLIAVPGGHHGSVQHDAELQAVSLRFVTRALAGDRSSARG